MAKFEINKDHPGGRSMKAVEADDFDTNGEFVDFIKDRKTVFRIAVGSVETIERVSE